MKKDIHIKLDEEVLEELNKMSEKTKILKSSLVNSIIDKSLKEIKELNYNFTEFLNRRK